MIPLFKLSPSEYVSNLKLTKVKSQLLKVRSYLKDISDCEVALVDGMCQNFFYPQFFTS